MTSIFSYGTLRCPQVRSALLERQVTVQEDVFVKGFKIHPVVLGLYPAVLESSLIDDIVPGTLIYGIEAEELAILDLFEDEYVKRQILVYSAHNHDPTPAIIYVWNCSESCLDKSRAWNFELDYLGQVERKRIFVDNTAAFRGKAISEVRKSAINIDSVTNTVY